MTSPAPDVTIITDGSALLNPGPGGWAAIMIARNGTAIEISGCQKRTTNNRMEITALLEGLKRLKRPCRVHVISDSKYVIKSVSEWMPGWKRRGWVKGDGKAPENLDLWQEIDALLSATPHQLNFEWVKGHNGHTYNERVDVLARTAAEAQRDGKYGPYPMTNTISGPAA